MTKQRERNEPEPGEFRDPLKDYSPKHYSDEFERSLCEDPVGVIEQQPYIAVAPETSVSETLRIMADRNIACVVITDTSVQPIGIFSEQDVVHRVAGRFEEVASSPITSVMTRDPIVVYESENPARVLGLMGGGYFRHLPVCNVDGKLIGVIGARRMINYLKKKVGN